MKLVIRSVSTWDHENIRSWHPDDPSNVAEEIFLDIGEKSGQSSDTFYIRVATPAGLDTLDARDGILATRPLLVMRSYNYDDLWRWLERTVASCERETWPDCVQRLCLYFGWEYDGYRES